MRKKIIVTSMVVLLCLGNILAGCGKSEQPAQGEEKEKIETVDVGNGEETSAADTQETDRLNVFINMPWYEVDSFTGIIPEEIKKQTGVELDVTLATDANQLGVMIGSGDLPDLIFTDVELDRLSNSSLCYSYVCVKC